jgi:hypothetical protein
MINTVRYQDNTRRSPHRHQLGGLRQDLPRWQQVLEVTQLLQCALRAPLKCLHGVQ